jgi:hypothetical protein
MFICAENVSGLKLYTEMMNLIFKANQVVAERPVSQWSIFKKRCRDIRIDNAGMSNDK